MRTTVTLDPDAAKVLRDEQYRTKKTFKEVLDSAVRASLQGTPSRRPRLLPARAMGLRTGIDPRELAGLAAFAFATGWQPPTSSGSMRKRRISPARRNWSDPLA